MDDSFRTTCAWLNYLVIFDPAGFAKQMLQVFSIAKRSYLQLFQVLIVKQGQYSASNLVNSKSLDNLLFEVVFSQKLTHFVNSPVLHCERHFHQILLVKIV